MVLGFLLLLSFGKHKSYSYQVKSQSHPVILTNETVKTSLSFNLEILEDKSRELTINDITSPPYENQFIPNHQDPLTWVFLVVIFGSDFR
ncbi:hypothetical protein [Cyanothece sp. BG0011]|uniref:hypothetical protein n=1 Tax=Cyanothece sp. BG0011 TaxID=2082950 RepID=UPI000D1D8F90|nr:hypothetical protein [Cyanothece sp. BG0011]